jgi:transposase
MKITVQAGNEQVRAAFTADQVAALPWATNPRPWTCYLEPWKDGGGHWLNFVAERKQGPKAWCDQLMLAVYDDGRVIPDHLEVCRDPLKVGGWVAEVLPSEPRRWNQPVTIAGASFFQPILPGAELDRAENDMGLRGHHSFCVGKDVVQDVLLDSLHAGDRHRGLQGVLAYTGAPSVGFCWAHCAPWVRRVWYGLARDARTVGRIAREELERKQPSLEVLRASESYLDRARAVAYFTSAVKITEATERTYARVASELNLAVPFRIMV